MQKYKVGFLIGRFQPFHKGHLYLMRKSFQHVNTMVIGVGSVGVVNQDNFLSFGQRKKILEEVCKKEDWNDKVSKIVPLKDYYNDELWLKHTLEVSGKIDVVIGNNEWTNGIFERAGYPVLRLGFYKRYLYEGVKIRELMREGKKWESRIPNYLVNFVRKSR
ncbi:hypothetical protein A3I50_03670 [Candidatus Roizmanbacteria bacterium RIFCSPLOWO2_02_FULL_37_9]|uniref:Cytidyltransferase-like domain-containing protein n=1 Tax=Candidatus Roizmanbacteria bacterium RIFCSPLOWO2_01_FULL_37_16 TaxID=1802058 RepID=A0A1F7IPG3_9BACT|nr:MAG: hypothetical protein A2859_00730 [Candidatus Roizmanbacteria bacterium RIFCSPHIGHO2_01_FULL_37_16b]OGK31693.1 MAG: hypothetical protein A3F57_01720 [Candidatus Roizmanbacteria bacterium RIFCSPHIGHO2_12_FULL_36_11]OGK45162.1 MAG: hypothetical protein A3B40_02015 [Candidatus Roizmanbacteria bacterium RIFCSPLOWO2_01_FULL_37_16]OGK56291.1 MAG: hypothetical protein A3I50_03670 [Candidatus Roizmanbacteria bacterium RIFCSPLOWO2_02_FULL_37_9]